MSYAKLYHNFFHAPESRGRYAGANVSFEGDTFYSYGTAIALKVRALDGRPALLVSSDTFSMTTGGHIRALRSACPYDVVIEVPGFSYGRYYVTVRDIADTIAAALLMKGERTITRAETRRNLSGLIHSARTFARLIAPLPADAALEAANQIEAEIVALEQKREAARARRASESPEDKARREALAARRRERLLAGLAEKSYLDRVRLLCGRSGGLTRGQRLALGETLAPGGVSGYSLIWIEGGEVRTSQGVRMPADTVRAVITRWRKGSLEAGQHVGPYAIRELATDYVQIGCHKIPRANIEALEEALNA